MIISTVITVTCFLVIISDLINVLAVFKSCKSVKCSVISSKKVSVREDGYLVREYYKTEISFELEGTSKTATLETSTFCQKGQMLNCWYYPKRNIVFRKRDIKTVLNGYAIPAFSVGVLFLSLNLIFHITSLGGLIVNNSIIVIGVILTTVFATLAVWFIWYSVIAFRATKSPHVSEVKAEIIDIVKKSKRHRENVHATFYPIYKYNLNGSEHIVKSKLGREYPPRKNSKENILVNVKKGSLAEFKDIGESLILGICFLIIAGLFIYVLAFMK